MTCQLAGTSPSRHRPRVGFWNRGRRHIVPILAMVRVWSRRLKRRRFLTELEALGERTMRDLGFDPDSVRAEAAKPFWRP